MSNAMRQEQPTSLRRASSGVQVVELGCISESAQTYILALTVASNADVLSRQDDWSLSTGNVCRKGQDWWNQWAVLKTKTKPKALNPHVWQLGT